jgi:hypothetical protein
VKEGYEGGGLRKEGGILFFFGEGSLGFEFEFGGEFEFCSREGSVQGAPVCWGFWARGPGYPYGILELGSCPSWQGGNTVWAELVSGIMGKAAAGRSTRQAEAAGRSTRQAEG